jgi:hypothetical protein
MLLGWKYIFYPVGQKYELVLVYQEGIDVCAFLLD